MGSPYGPVLAGQFMVHLKKIIMLELEKSMNSWKRCVDDAITYIKSDGYHQTDIIKILHKIHEIIKFTYKVEHNGKI